jgi:hypothetical protein
VNKPYKGDPLREQIAPQFAMLSQLGRETMSWSWKRSLIVTAVIVAVFVVYRVYSELAGHAFEERLKRIEGDAKKSLPMKLDDVTTLVDLKYGADKTTYWYVMSVASDGFDAKDLEQRVGQRMCANEELWHAINERGFSYEYHYVNKAQSFLTAFTIAKCP